MTTRGDVLEAMETIRRDGIPDGFNAPRIWFVQPPDGGDLLPAKAVWGVATRKTGKDFTAHQARDALRRLDFYVPNPVKNSAGPALSPEDLTVASEHWEGAERQVTRNVRERDPKARRACEAYYRAHNDGHLRCEGCKIDFAVIYGPRGEGFIHFHHLAPLSEADGPRKISGEVDLVPVCPNCHAMIHRTQPILSMRQLSILLARSKD